MNIYILKPNPNVYRILVPAQTQSLSDYRQFNGCEIKDWAGFKVELLLLNERQDMLPGDFPGLTSHIPVFSPRAKDALMDDLAAAGQLLPLDVVNAEQRFDALNITTLVDALDLEQAEVKRFSSGRIMRIQRHAFLPEKVAGLNLFKIPETPLQDVYAGQAFLEAVRDSGLEGFVFKLVWTDEDYLILCPYCSGVIEESTDVCPTCGLDTRNDAPWELTLAEAAEMKRAACQGCGTRILPWADPCPYCRQGARREGQRCGVTVVV